MLAACKTPPLVPPLPPGACPDLSSGLPSQGCIDKILSSGSRRPPKFYCANVGTWSAPQGRSRRRVWLPAADASPGSNGRSNPRGSNDCNGMVTRFLAARTPGTVTVLGDSVTRGWFWGFAVLNGCTRTRDLCEAKPRCGLLRYMNSTAAGTKQQWTPPRPALEGPALWLGKPDHTPYCSDLGCSGRGCKYFYAQTHTCPTKKSTLEYLPVEFAKDVAFPSVLGARLLSTTQASVAEYLSRAPRDLCVANSGIHDLVIANITDAQHVSNVAEYIGHLASGCKRLVWLSTTSTCNMAQYAQTNLRIIRMNVLVQEMIVDTFPDVAVIDVFPMSLSIDVKNCACKDGEYVGDNVHFKPEYGDTIGGWITLGQDHTRPS